MTSLAADKEEFYRQFRSFTIANLDAWQVTSPLLVDTNNTGFKLTNVLLHLEKLRTTESVGGIRPGMTMDEVVKEWGKPPEIWAKGPGGPRFVYKEVSVFFEPATNSVKMVYTHDLPSLARELSVTRKIDDCLRALGEPTYRDDATVASQSFLVYQLTNTVIKVGCIRSRLASIQLDRLE